MDNPIRMKNLEATRDFLQQRSKSIQENNLKLCPHNVMDYQWNPTNTFVSDAFAALEKHMTRDTGTNTIKKVSEDIWGSKRQQK